MLFAIRRIHISAASQGNVELEVDNDLPQCEENPLWRQETRVPTIDSIVRSLINRIENHEELVVAFRYSSVVK